MTLEDERGHDELNVKRKQRTLSAHGKVPFT